MLDNYINYNPVKWSATIDRQVNKSDKYPLIKIDNIPITKNEIDTIQSIKNIRLERLAFVILCFAKFSNLRSENNNDWVNREIKEIFKLARLPVVISKQCLMLNDLKKLGLIEYSKKVDNVNINVQYIDNDSEILLRLTDFRELGYEYMLFKGEKYIRCGECGILIKQKNNRVKYCKGCGIETKKEKDRIRMENSRK